MLTPSITVEIRCSRDKKLRRCDVIFTKCKLYHACRLWKYTYVNKGVASVFRLPYYSIDITTHFR